jgi:hypothetical protein
LKLAMQNLLRHFHLAMTFVWLALIAPSVLWWKDSVPWVVFMSVWANLVTHFGAYMAARAERQASENG